MPKLLKSNPKLVYLRNSPLRKPRWRYEFASQLIEKKLKPDRCDPLISEMHGLLKDFKKLEDVSDEDLDDRRMLIFSKYPNAYHSYELFTNPELESLKHSIEARLLAQISEKRIAELSGYLTETISYYEATFYNIKDRLQQEDYIARVAIGPVIGHGLHNMHGGSVLKFFAYYGGKDVLEYILTGHIPSDTKPSGGVEVLDFMEKVFESGIRTKATETALCYNVNAFNAPHLLDLRARLKEHELEVSKSRGDGGQHSIQYAENIQAMIGVAQWSVGAGRKQILEKMNLSGFADNAAELRASEMVAIAAGASPKDLGVEHLASLTLPPPRKVEKKDA